MLLLSMATFALGRGIGLQGWLAVIAAQFVGICSFPPMWLWSSQWTHLDTLLYGLAWGTAIPTALGTTLIAIYCHLGKLSSLGNWVCLVSMPLVVVYSILCDPLYTAMFFLTSGFFLAGVLCGSGSRHVFAWRLFGGAACIASSRSPCFTSTAESAGTCRCPIIWSSQRIRPMPWPGCSAHGWRCKSSRPGRKPR